jgi:hypothetical protein
MAAYGLRPKELQHLQIRHGRLWWMDEMSPHAARPGQECCGRCPATTGQTAGASRNASQPRSCRRCSIGWVGATWVTI